MSGSIRNLKECVHSLGSPRVLVVGDLMLDRYSWCGVERISPEAPVPVLDVRREENYAGGASNVAIKVVELGGRASIAGLVGTDPEGKLLRSCLQEGGVDIFSVHEVSGRPTTLKHRIIAQAQQVVRVDREQRKPVDETERKRLLDGIYSQLSESDVLVISDYNKGVLSKKVLSGIILSAREKGIPVIVDPKGTDYSRYEGATLLTPNVKEAMAATGIWGENDDSTLRKCAKKIFEITGCEYLVITRSERGMTVYSKDGSEKTFAARRREVYDVTGAGDSVAATFALSIGSGLSAHEAATLAIVTAGLTVSQLGVGHVSREDVSGVVSGGLVSSRDKFLSQSELLEKLEAHRLAGKKIVFTNGCFDLIHVGHIMTLEMSKELGDILVVALNSDESVRRLKGANRPIISQSSRASIIASLEQVNYVTLFDEDTPLDLIVKLMPDVLVKGGDWSVESVVGSKEVLANGGEVEIVKLVDGFSTTNIIERVLEVYGGENGK